MPDSTQIGDKAKQQLQLDFPLPTDKAFRADIKREQFWELFLFALNAIYNVLVSKLGDIAGGLGVGEATPSSVNVTQLATTVLLADTKVRRVQIINNSTTNDVIVLEGGDPFFNGQTAEPYDWGYVLGPGDGYTSESAHKSVIKARCRTGETARITVTKYQ